MQEVKELEALIKANQASTPRARLLVDLLKAQVFARPALLVGQPSQGQLKEAIEVAELAVLYSLATGNIREFGLNMPRLRMFYDRLKTKSAKQNTFQALYLLEMLSQNKVSEFYFQLERIPLELLQDQQIAFVVRLQRCLSSGQYGAIFRQESNPLIYSQVFVDIIAAFARQEIARSVESAYQKISLADCARLHHLPSQANMLAFTKQQMGRENPEVVWTLEGSIIKFRNTNVRKNQLQSQSKLAMAVGFAQDLQRII